MTPSRLSSRWMYAQSGGTRSCTGAARGNNCASSAASSSPTGGGQPNPLRAALRRYSETVPTPTAQAWAIARWDNPRSCLSRSAAEAASGSAPTPTRSLRLDRRGPTPRGFPSGPGPATGTVRSSRGGRSRGRRGRPRSDHDALDLVRPHSPLPRRPRGCSRAWQGGRGRATGYRLRRPGGLLSSSGVGGRWASDADAAEGMTERRWLTRLRSQRRSTSGSPWSAATTAKPPSGVERDGGDVRRQRRPRPPSRPARPCQRGRPRPGRPPPWRRDVSGSVSARRPLATAAAQQQQRKRDRADHPAGARRRPTGQSWSPPPGTHGSSAARRRRPRGRRRRGAGGGPAREDEPGGRGSGRAVREGRRRRRPPDASRRGEPGARGPGWCRCRRRWWGCGSRRRPGRPASRGRAPRPALRRVILGQVLGWRGDAASDALGDERAGCLHAGPELGVVELFGEHLSLFVFTWSGRQGSARAPSRPSVVAEVAVGVVGRAEELSLSERRIDLGGGREPEPLAGRRPRSGRGRGSVPVPTRHRRSVIPSAASASLAHRPPRPLDDNNPPGRLSL